MPRLNDLYHAIWKRDRLETMTPEPRGWVWGRDYGKDILADLNALAHSKGTDILTRDALQRAYKEIDRLRKRGNGQAATRPEETK